MRPLVFLGDWRDRKVVPGREYASQVCGERILVSEAGVVVDRHGRPITK